jgi:hypothetical protein
LSILVLSTSVINKAIVSGQKLRRKADSPMSLVDSAVQTDSEMSESSEINSNKNQYSKKEYNIMAYTLQPIG